MHFSKSFGNFERQLPLKKGMGKFQRHLPLKLNQSPSKLGSLPVEVIGFSSQGQNAYRPLVSEACLGRFRVIFFNSALCSFKKSIHTPYLSCPSCYKDSKALEAKEFLGQSENWLFRFFSLFLGCIFHLAEIQDLGRVKEEKW